MFYHIYSVILAKNRSYSDGSSRLIGENGLDKISIIVPVYNLEKYIEKTVLSIRNQTYKDIEIILIDDGSTDGSGIILDKIAGEDNRVLAFHQKNGGVTAARLTGIREASGDWIGFVDGDDYIEPDMYERLLKNARRYQADISHCGYQMVFPGRTNYYYNTGHLVCQDSQTGVKDILEGRFVEPSLCNKLYRSVLFNRMLTNDLIDLKIKNNEDLLMNYYLFSAAKKSVYEDICPYHYMVRAGSAATSKLSESKLRDPLKVLTIISEDIGYKKELKQIIDRRRIALLVSQATMSAKDNKEKILPHRCTVRKELRKLAFDIIRGDFSAKLKIQVIWAAVWPWSYGAVHRIYAKVTGLDKKYSVE